jgi:hypothetical protein
VQRFVGVQTFQSEEQMPRDGAIIFSDLTGKLAVLNVA